jgi:DNA-binding transcriptional LysR family regulator
VVVASVTTSIESAVVARTVPDRVAPARRSTTTLCRGAIVSTTDLIATLPRHIGETLAAAGGLRVHPCPVTIPTFTVKQHWHARYHQEPANRWLRSVVAALFMRGASPSP